MALLKIFNTTGGNTNDPLELKDVRLSPYRDCQIVEESETLILYELSESLRENNNYKVSKDSKNEKLCFKFDLVIKNNKYKDYGVSLRRLNDAAQAKEAFAQLEKKFPLLIKASDSFPNKDVLRNFMTLTSDHPSWTIAHIAVQLSLLDVLKSNLVSSIINERCAETGRTPFHMAIEAQNISAAQTLVDQKARADVCDNKGNTAFHYVINSDSKSLLEIVSRAQGATVAMNQKNDEGQTPLQVACVSGYTGCVEQLLRQGVDVNSASFTPNDRGKQKSKTLGDKDIGIFSERQMKKGGTPLHWVKSRASLEMMIEVGCDVNATNSAGDTALHVVASKRRLDSLVWLLIEGADVNFKGSGGDTPLHVAVRSAIPPKVQDKWMLFKQKVEQKNYGWQKNDGIPIVQILLAFGADLNARNDKGETPRHIAAVMASDNHLARLDQLLYILHAVGAKRCKERTPNCTDGCRPKGAFDGVPPTELRREKKKIFEGPMSEPIVKKKIDQKNNSTGVGKRCRALAIDGGGVKGLITIRTLKCLEEITGKPLLESFDWVMGTSAGGITTLCLATGHDVDNVFRSAFRLKEKFIVGPRPYDTDGVEAYLKKELGEDTKICDIEAPRIAVTAVNAESFPTRLKLFRNYHSPRSLLDNSPEPPDDENIWCAARATGAAPTFFKPYKKYVDGAIICNNPTLDLITEITEYNAAMEDTPSEQLEVDILVSVGGGMRPRSPVGTIDALQLDPGIFGAAKVAYSVGHLMKFAVEQISEPDGRHVDRARAWCYGIGIPYARLQPALSQIVPVNESDNRVIAKVLWETMAYFKEHADELQLIAELLDND